MKNLLYKEFTLAKHPTMFFFPLFACMLLIPSYPYLVSFMYTCLEVFFIFIFGRETSDVLYTASLPIPKRDVVKARCVMIVILQLFQVLLSIPFAVLRGRMTATVGGNGAGMEANVALFGFALLLYAVFNIAFLPAFYKNAHSTGRGLLFGGIGVFLVIGLEMVLSFTVPWLDSIAPADQLRQIPILIGGMVCYAVGMLLAYRISASRFERVDL